MPLSLEPDGAFAIGIKVGRRSLEILLVVFVGEVRLRWSLAYPFPDPDLLLAEIGLRLREIGQRLGPVATSRMQGVGIAAPLSMGGWQGLLGFDNSLAERWQRTDLRAEVAALTELPVALIKDTAAACVAELVAGRGRNIKSFLYVFVDTFIGGGLVIDSHLRMGLHGNAGAIGSLPLGLARVSQPMQKGNPANATSPPEQLLSMASLLNLEQRYIAARLDPDAAADARALQPPWLRHTQAWLVEAAGAIALAVNSAACLLDLDGVIVDGSFSRELLAALTAALEVALTHYRA